MTQWCRLHGAVACPLCFPRPVELMLMEDEHLQRQITEDTCEAHGAFCCPVCFDMTPIDWSNDRLVETDENWEIVTPREAPLDDLLPLTKREEWLMVLADLLSEGAWLLSSLGMKGIAKRLDIRVYRITMPITERRMGT